MPDPTLAAYQAGLDQQKAQMREKAGLVLAFYRGLRDDGAKRDEALTLSCALIMTTFKQGDDEGEE